MKPIFTLFCFSFSLVVFGQNYSVSTLSDRDSLKIVALYENPTDSTKLLALEDLGYANGWVNYKLFSVDLAGNYLPFISPIIGTLRSRPVELDGEYFFAAETQSLGVELIVFDGTTPLIINVEIGAIGSEPYNLKVENNLLYFSAIVAGEHQLFSFSHGTGLNQITSETDAVNLNFIATIDGNIIYSKDYSDNTSELRKLNGLGSTVVLRSSNFLVTGWYTTWNDAIKDGTTYLFSETLTDFQESKLRVVGSTDFVNCATILEENVLNSGSSARLEKLNGITYAKLNHYFTTLDGQIFSQFFPSFSQEIRELFSFNNGIYGIANAVAGEPEMIYKFEGGVATELYSNRHLHLILVNNYEAYFSDWNPDPTMSSGIVRLSNDEIDTIAVSLNGIHSPNDHAALMWDQKLTFLYSNSQPIDNTDIMQLDGFLAVCMLEKSGFALFPNPVKAESQLMFTSPKESLIECFDAIGNKVKTQKIFLGYNSIDLNGLLPGTYFLKIDEHTFKQIIE